MHCCFKTTTIFKTTNLLNNKHFKLRFDSVRESIEIIWTLIVNNLIFKFFQRSGSRIVEPNGENKKRLVHRVTTLSERSLHHLRYHFILHHHCLRPSWEQEVEWHILQLRFPLHHKLITDHRNLWNFQYYTTLGFQTILQVWCQVTFLDLGVLVASME